MTKLAGHVQRLNGNTIDHLKRALYPAIKCLTGVDLWQLRDKILPSYDEEDVGRPFLWVRKWIDANEQKQWVDEGIDGAHKFFERTVRGYDEWRDLTNVIESVNEFIPWTDDDMRRLCGFECELTRLYHEHGNRVIVGNFSNGWPKIEHWPLYSAMMAHADFLGLHGYAWPEGIDANDGVAFLWHPWRIMRFEKARQTILSHKMRLPPIILTEIGWDRAVWQGDHAGFRKAPSPNAYYDWLVGYDERIASDDDVRYAAIFQTGAAEDWSQMGFDIAGHYVGNCLADYTRVDALRQHAPEPPTGLGLTDYELARGKKELAILPATMKWCNERGYAWYGEWSDDSAGFVYCLAWDPKTRGYRQMKGDTEEWKVLDDKPLVG